LQRVREVALGAYAHQDVPFEQLVDLLQPERDLSRSPLFQVMFDLQHLAASASQGGGEPLALRNLEVTRRSTKFDLTLTVLSNAQTGYASLAYNTDLFASGTIQLLLERWLLLLREVLAQPQRCLDEIALLTPREQELLCTWNATAADYARERCIHELIAQQAEATPEAIALGYGEEELSYAELNRRALHLAAHLRALGVGGGQLVGICLERSLDLLLALLATLYSGAAYVPLDPAYPAERLAFMLADSQATLLITREHLAASLPAGAAPLFCLPPAGDAPAEPSLPQVCSSQLAYVIYTSGSTGRPKGVAIPHRAVSNFFHSMRQRPGISARDHVLASTSLSFDIAVLELLLPLTVGARVQLVSREVVTSPPDLAAHLAQGAVTLMQATPTAWRLLLSSGWPGQPGLKMLCGGEALPRDLATQLLTKGASLWNMYGPTETTIWSAVAACRGPVQRVVIGQPIANTRLYVLDQWLRPRPLTVAGELYIAGEGLADGYVRRPDLCAARFLPDPFSPRPGARMYRSGDLARWLRTGALECLGRVDRQVKIRGLRVEPGEIEALLAEHPLVQLCAVAIREPSPQQPQVVAYVVATAGGAPAASELRAYLQGRLPGSMLPERFVLLPELPCTPNGKVDYQGLPAPREEEPLLLEAQPDTALEEILCTVWSALLGGVSVGLHDNFFALGGHSLSATRLVARLSALLQLELPVRELFEAPTVAQLAARLEQILRGQQAPVPEAPLVRTNLRQAPLSFAQQRLWFLEQLQPGGSAYLITNAHHLQGPLSPLALQQAFSALVRRQASLRTTFDQRAGQPFQVIHPAGSSHLPVVDLQGLSQQAQERVARHLGQQEAGQPCDLAAGPLLRLWLLRQGRLRHVLLISLHHLITDGWSNGLFYQELTALYQGLCAGQSAALPELPIQYLDYALWQRQWLQGAVLEAHLAYWQQQLAGAAVLTLPTDYRRPPVQSLRGAHLAQILPATLQTRLKKLSGRANITLFMLLLAAFQVLLARYSGQDDICVGTPIANRSRSELEGLIGFFANTLVLRATLADNPTFDELLARTREVALAAYAHQELPFELLVERLQPVRDLSHTPLFQVMFVMQQESVQAPAQQQPEPTPRALARAAFPLEEGSARFDLTLSVASDPQGLYCGLEYSTDLFARASMQRLLAHWQILLEGIVRQPGARVADLPLLSPQERECQLLAWNATARPLPDTDSFPQLFARQAQAAPDSLALVYAEQQLTYGSLAQHAGRLAAYLRARGIGPEAIVGIYLARSPELVIALLGVLLAGGAYMPLDRSLPAARVRLQLDETCAALLLTTADGASELELAPPRVLCLEREWEPLARVNACQEVVVQGQQLAYVIYTSGSSGRPKGVMISQRGLVNYLTWCCQYYQVHTGYGSVVHSSIGFDLTITSLFSPLLVGRPVFLLAEQQEVHGLVDFLEQQGGLSVLKITPAHLDLLQHTLAEGQLAGLTQAIVIGGEALAAESLVRWRIHAPETRLINEYGPTETVVGCCIYEDSAGEVATGAFPIGRPIANTQLFVLDTQLRPLPVGVVGELSIGGVGVARGYIQRPDLTAERFVPHPYSQVGGERLYRSGDLACYRADGTLTYVGRRDSQVKIRGFRIEPGEIEAVLQEHPAVEASAVVVCEDARAGRQLVAYVVSSQQPQASVVARLYTYVQQRLPAYMLPAHILLLDALPLTTHGKVDRQALPAPVARAETDASSQEPRTPVEELLLAVWREVLGRQQIGIDENFFGLGGHSLLAVQVLSRLRTLFGQDLPLRALFQAPTIASLAALLSQPVAPGEPAQPALVPQVRPTPLPLSFAQQRLWYLHQLAPTSSAYLMPQRLWLPAELRMQALQASLAALLGRHESLRTAFREQAGQPFQHIVPSLAPALPLVDLSSLPTALRQQQARRLSEQEGVQPMEIQVAPLLRTTLVRFSPHHQLLLLTLHHLIADGWSLRLLWRDWRHLYQLARGQESLDLPEPVIQYADYALWQRTWLQGALLERRLDYWVQQLGAASPLRLPAGQPAASSPTADVPESLLTRFHFSAELSAQVWQGCQQHTTTPFLLLLAAFCAQLSRMTGQLDLLVGTDSANRQLRETEEVVGCFINLLPLRLRLGPGWSFARTLAQGREVLLEGSRQELPFEMLVEHLGLARGERAVPLVRVLLVWQGLAREDEGAQQPGRRSGQESGQREERRAAKFDVAIFAWRGADGIEGIVQFQQEQIARGHIQELLLNWQRLLSVGLREPETPMEQLVLYQASELAHHQSRQRQLLDTFRQQESEWFELPDFA
jgi:amino acid adenylation domain-containing protein